MQQDEQHDEAPIINEMPPSFYQSAEKEAAETKSIVVFEFLGTLLIVYGALASNGQNFGISLCYFVALIFFGRLCGGHFNPIITLIGYIDGSVTKKKAIYYAVAQFTAGIVAGMIFLPMLNLEKAPYYENQPGKQMLGTMFAEVAGSMIFFVFVQLQTVESTRLTQTSFQSAFFISVVYFIAREYTASMDNSLFNPAAAFGYAGALLRDLLRQVEPTHQPSGVHGGSLAGVPHGDHVLLANLRAHAAENQELTQQIMHTELNIVQLQQLLSNIFLSTSHEDDAVRFFIRKGLDQKTLQTLCDESLNHFHFNRSTQEVDKLALSYIRMAQKVMEHYQKSEPSNINLRETFKKYIQSLLGKMRDTPLNAEVHRLIKDFIRGWEERGFFTRSEVQAMLQTFDPSKNNEKLKTQFAPPNALYNFTKNNKDLTDRLQKQQALQSKLDELIAGGCSESQFDQTFEQFQKATESVNKYRNIVLKDIMEILKDLEKVHYKSIIDLKYIVQRLDELKQLKEKKLSDNYYIV